MLDRMKGPILKSRDEIAVMDRANRVVLEILEIMRAMVKPGVTTAQLNAVAEEELAKRGAKSPFKGYSPMGLPPYPAVVCSSVNDVIVHGIPNRAKLQEGDIVGLDFGAVLDGFVGDGAITVPVGKVSPRAQELCDTTRECLELAIKEMVPGDHLGFIRAITSATSVRQCRNTPSRAASTSSAISSDTESDAGCTRTHRSTTTVSADAVSSCARGWCWRSSRCSVTSVRSCVIASKRRRETGRWKTFAPIPIAGRRERSTGRWQRILNIQ